MIQIGDRPKTLFTGPLSHRRLNQYNTMKAEYHTQRAKASFEENYHLTASKVPLFSSRRANMGLDALKNKMAP